jgi:predicted enzyme related to lactoylglutathione lyase
MARVVHFEVPADDPERSIRFYGEVFGWKFTKWAGPMDYWLISTGEGMGIDGGLMKKNEGQPVTNTIGVEDLDRSLLDIERAGGTIVVPKMPIPGVGWLAYFKDPDENIFGVMQPDTSAA